MADWLWYAIAGTAGVFALSLLLWGWFSDRPRGRRRCPKCWYDMAASTASAVRSAAASTTVRGDSIGVA